ncbi:hypothetical protein BBOV_VI_pgp13 (apicoplast) [Babesia bovis T2Bo]|uniref:Uncharacterized protein n=1 Tax=Babesia bovis TaxID=5865 RepID=A7AXG0_BABBO|nr:hypothetical protein BBOV_VI_pgp13 [Babesia bovis T2Bo]EDO05083.1 hypothetical protein BBOV_V000330 [Babesia bovis T2Bo]|eukprot:YP_002290863.1 hypothetical protein BBOV_V000330 (apicoplast) [Babesia bovis T2Bo]
MKQFNKIMKKELILTLFSKFVQKQGKYTKSKKLIINISDSLSLISSLDINFTSILEYMIYKLNLPIIMIDNKVHKLKYYFLVMAPLKYIKKYIYSYFLKAVNSKKKLPFKHNFILELNNVLNDSSSVVEYKEEVLGVFEDTNASVRTNKTKNLKTCEISNNFMYANLKLKHVNRRYNNKNYYKLIKQYGLPNKFSNTKVNYNRKQTNYLLKNVI